MRLRRSTARTLTVGSRTDEMKGVSEMKERRMRSVLFMVLVLAERNTVNDCGPHPQSFSGVGLVSVLGERVGALVAGSAGAVSLRKWSRMAR